MSKSLEHEIGVKVTGLRYLQSLYTEEKHYARFGGCRPYSLGDIEHLCKMSQSHCSMIYRSRLPGQELAVSVH